MREMKDSGVEWIGEIPKDWKVSKAKYFYDCLDGKRVPIDSSQRENGQYPYWGAGSITDYVSNYLFDEELVLLGEDGAPFFDDTRPVAFLVSGKIWVNNHIHVLKVKKNFSARFLTHFLNIVDYGSYINGSILCKLTQSNMNSISIVYPILNKQERIASYLESKCSQIDAIIKKQQTVIEKLKEYKLSLITEAVTKGLNPDVPMKDSGVEWIGEIPEHWDVPKIKYIASIYSGATPDRNKLEYWNGEINWFKTGELQNNEIYYSEENITQKALNETSVKMFYEDTILMAMYGQGKTRGMTALLKTQGTTNQACAGIIINNKKMSVKYMWEFLKGAYNAIRQEAVGSGQPNLSVKLIADFYVTMPPMEEQRQIADFLDRKCSAIDATITKKQALIEKLTAYKKSLIYEVVTGKKEV